MWVIQTDGAYCIVPFDVQRIVLQVQRPDSPLVTRSHGNSELSLEMHGFHSIAGIDKDPELTNLHENQISIREEAFH